MSDDVKKGDSIANVDCFIALIGSIIAAIGISLMSGCASRYQTRVVSGVNMEIGLIVPGTDGALTLDLVSYTSGFKATAPTNAPFALELTSASSNDYFGVIHVRESIRAKLTRRLEEKEYK